MRQQDNERLTQVGPGTPMGRLIRAYWLPSLVSKEVAVGAPPLRVMLLGERLIAFRDSQGRVGLLEEKCPHRCASLFFARNEGSGLRCAYHGWKFDVTGECLETPAEPADSTLRMHVRARAYPCAERGGIVWAYLGPNAVPPPLPELEANLDDTHGEVDVHLVENNWLQALEGDVDIAHLPFLHAGNLDVFAKLLGTTRATFDETTARERQSHGAATVVSDSAPAPPRIEIADTPAGFAFAAAMTGTSTTSSSAATGTRWSVGHFMFPFYANLPYGVLGSYWVVARVPMDDHHTLTFGMWRRDVRRPPLEVMFGAEPAFLPNTSDWFGRFRLTRRLENDFHVDRGASHREGIAISGQAVQDTAITASMGTIVDRAREHLGKSDVAIIHLRRRLLAALDHLEESAPPALDQPGAYRVKQGVFQVPKGGAWHEELRHRGGSGSLTPSTAEHTKLG